MSYAPTVRGFWAQGRRLAVCACGRAHDIAVARRVRVLFRWPLVNMMRSWRHGRPGACFFGNDKGEERLGHRPRCLQCSRERGPAASGGPRGEHRMRKRSVWFFCLAVVGLAVLGMLPEVWASGGNLHHEAEEIGKHLGVFWVVPFVCMLLSIAIMPLAVPHFWHHHYGKVAAFWGVAFLVPFALSHGFDLALYSVVHTLFLEYIPFLILLFSLFTIAGGVCLRGSLVGKPWSTRSFCLSVLCWRVGWGPLARPCCSSGPSCAPSRIANSRCTPSFSSSFWWPTSAAA